MPSVEEYLTGVGQVCVLGTRNEDDEDGTYRQLVLRNLGPASIAVKSHRFVVTLQDPQGARSEQVIARLNPGILVVEPGSVYPLFSPKLLLDGVAASRDGRILASDLIGLPQADISAGFYSPSGEDVVKIRVKDFSRRHALISEPLLDTFRAEVFH